MTFVGSENAGRLVSSLSSVGETVAVDDAYDVVLVRNRGPSKIERIDEASPFSEPKSDCYRPRGVTRTPDDRLTELFVGLVCEINSMDEGDGFAGMETVTVELDAETLEEVDEMAFSDHRDNRAAAIRTLLDEWLKTRDE